MLSEPIIDTRANIIDPENRRKWTPLEGDLYVLTESEASTDELNYYQFRAQGELQGFATPEEFSVALKKGDLPALTSKWLPLANVSRDVRASFTTFPLHEEMFFSRMCNLGAAQVEKGTVSRRLAALDIAKRSGTHHARWQRVRQQVYNATPTEAVIFALRCCGVVVDLNKSKRELFMEFHALKQVPDPAVFLDSWHHYEGYVGRAESDPADQVLLSVELPRLLEEQMVFTGSQTRQAEAIRQVLSPNFLDAVLQFHSVPDFKSSIEDKLHFAIELEKGAFYATEEAAIDSQLVKNLMEANVKKGNLRAALRLTGFNPRELALIPDDQLSWHLQRAL